MLSPSLVALQSPHNHDCRSTFPASDTYALNTHVMDGNRHPHSLPLFLYANPEDGDTVLMVFLRAASRVRPAYENIVPGVGVTAVDAPTLPHRPVVRHTQSACFVTRV